MFISDSRDLRFEKSDLGGEQTDCALVGKAITVNLGSSC